MNRPKTGVKKQYHWPLLASLSIKSETRLLLTQNYSNYIVVEVFFLPCSLVRVFQGSIHAAELELGTFTSIGPSIVIITGPHLKLLSSNNKIMRGLHNCAVNCNLKYIHKFVTLIVFPTAGLYSFTFWDEITLKGLLTPISGHLRPWPACQMDLKIA